MARDNTGAEKTAQIRTISILYIRGASLGYDCGQNQEQWRARIYVRKSDNADIFETYEEG